METFRAIYAATPNHLVDLAMLTVVQTFSTQFAALRALLNATDGEDAPFLVLDAESQDEQDFADIKATADNPRPNEYTYSDSRVVTGYGRFDVGYIHVWSTGAVGQFAYTIVTDTIR